MLKEVTPQFLEKYEQYMIETGKSVTTVGIYLRSLRTILNLAREKKLMTSEQYPFGQKSKKKYEIPIGRNVKKALSIEDIRKIRDAKDLDKEAEFARDMWMFSFDCNLTTYVARQSYATLLRNIGISIEEISESLGHSNVSTTKSYLDSFPKEHKKETANKLAKLI